MFLSAFVPLELFRIDTVYASSPKSLRTFDKCPCTMLYIQVCKFMAQLSFNNTHSV